MLHWQGSKPRTTPPFSLWAASKILVRPRDLMSSCIQGTQRFHGIPPQPCNIPLFPDKASTTEAVKRRTVVRRGKILASRFIRRCIWNSELSFSMQLQLSLSNSDVFLDISTGAPEVQPAPGKLPPSLPRSRTIEKGLLRGFFNPRVTGE